MQEAHLINIKLNFGGFWRRAVAYVIDKTILQIVYVILFIGGLLSQGLDQSVWLEMGSDLYESFVDSGVVWIYYVITLFLEMVYFTWFHGSIGQTPGKMLMRLRVIQATGEPMTFGLAFLRWVGYLISMLSIYLGFLWIAFDHKARGWHDMIAGTVVVADKKGLDNELDII